MIDRAKVVHEYNAAGRHRIVVDGKPGDWTMYQHVAVSAEPVDGQPFVAAFSGYYHDEEYLIIGTAYRSNIKAAEDDG